MNSESGLVSQLKRVYLDQQRRLAEIENGLRELDQRKGDKLSERDEVLRGLTDMEQVLREHGVEPGELFTNEKGTITWRD